jgi:ribosome-binding protein aMBF1 (putative translation factor)
MKIQNMLVLANANLAKKIKIAKNVLAKIANANIAIVETSN